MLMLDDSLLTKESLEREYRTGTPGDSCYYSS